MPAWAGLKIGFADVGGDLEAEDGAAFAQYVIEDPVSGFDYIDTGKEGDYDINVDFAIQDQAASPDDENQIEVKIEIQLSEETGGAPSFDPYQPYLAGEYFCRYYRIRSTVQVDPVFGQIPEITRFQHHHVPVGSMASPGSIDDFATTPNGLEATGTRYIVDSPATGDFTGMEGTIAYLSETTDRNWRFYIPAEGQRVYNKAEEWWWEFVKDEFGTGFWSPGDYRSAVSASRSATTSSTFQTKTPLTTPAHFSGTYRVGWSALVDNNADLGEYRLRNTTDGVDVTGIVVWKANDSNEFQSVGGFAEVVFAKVAKTFEIQFRDQSGGNVQGIQQARIEIWRIR